MSAGAFRELTKIQYSGKIVMSSDREHHRIAEAVRDRDPIRAQLAAAHIRATHEWLEGLRPAPEP